MRNVIKSKYVLGVLATVFVLISMHPAEYLDQWNQREKGLITSMGLHRLPPIPKDPSNRYAENTKAAELGRKIFQDAKFSRNGQVSCASCHQNNYNFTDNLSLAKGLGEMNRRSMPLEGVAYQKWFFWDGRKDALWAQVLDPIESPIEHGISRVKVAQLIKSHYLEEYRNVFGTWPNIDPYKYADDARPNSGNITVQEHWDQITHTEQQQLTHIYVNIGKSIAAFVRTLKPSESPFDQYALAIASGSKEGLSALNEQQKLGLKVFLNQGACVNCHNGPLLSNGEFHHVGIPDSEQMDEGRSAVVKTIEQNEFGCLTEWSDADPTRDCDYTKFRNQNTGRYTRAFKTPSLRNVAIRAPYMHAGQFSSLKEVLKNYQKVSGVPPVDEIIHDKLTNEELVQLEAFLESLTSIE